MGDKVTLLPLRAVSCSQRNALGTNHSPLTRIQVTVFTVSYLALPHNFLQAHCGFACRIACL